MTLSMLKAYRRYMAEDGRNELSPAGIYLFRQAVKWSIGDYEN